jgi:iron complex outermembrane receptor protein
MPNPAVRSQVGTALAASMFSPFGFVPEARAQESAEGLDEIVVTARRREENLQTVPLAITAST